MTIDVTYGSSVTGSGFASQIETDFSEVVAAYDKLFTNPITVYIEVDTMSSGLGQSSTYYTNPIAYSAWYAVASADASAAQNTVGTQAMASLSPTAQAAGTSGITMSTANAKALGFLPSDYEVNGNSPDSVLSFNVGLMSFTGDPTPGQYDFFSVAQHELDEALGIGSTLTSLANNASAPASATPDDQFRYSAPGSHSFTTDPSATAYFSVDGGTTNLATFNQNSGYGDRNDWAYSGCPATPANIQDAVGCTDQATGLITGASVEAVALEALGYDPLPEPASVFLFGTAIAGLLATRRRRQA